MVKRRWAQRITGCNGHTLGSRPEGHDGGIGAECWRECEPDLLAEAVSQSCRDAPGGQLRRRGCWNRCSRWTLPRR